VDALASRSETNINIYIYIYIFIQHRQEERQISWIWPLGHVSETNINMYIYIYIYNIAKNMDQSAASDLRIHVECLKVSDVLVELYLSNATPHKV